MGAFRYFEVLNLLRGTFHKAEKKQKKNILLTNTYLKVKFFVIKSNIYHKNKTE